MRCTPVRYTPMRHAYEIHTLEMYARKVWGGNLQISHLTNVGAVVDSSRSELQNTSFCAEKIKVLMSLHTRA